MLPTLLLAAASLALAGPLPGALPDLACSSVLEAVGTSNGDGTWHYDLTATHTCLVRAEGYLSVTDDFEAIFHFESCEGVLQCETHAEGEAHDADCLHIAAFTVALQNLNASQDLCAP